jgi:hypothetical protein
VDISIEIDTEKLLRRIDSMRSKISHLKRIGIGQEMSLWQVQDMHRHRPFTLRRRAMGEAETKVRPHSLLTMLRSQGMLLTERQRRGYARAVRKHLKHEVKRLRIKYRQPRRHASMRPILRSELEHQLFLREVEAMNKALKW